MDPQKLSQLDPKLRDAYQRVMGTAIPQSQPAPAPEPQPEPISAPNIEPAAQPEPFFKPPPAIDPNSQSIPMSEPAVPAQQPAAASQNFTAPPPMPQVQTAAIKKKSGITPILFGIAALVFLMIYTLFWTKIFNFKLPFLP